MSNLLKEINEQPRVLEDVLRKESSNLRKLAKELSKREVKFLFIAARGSSDNAALFAKYLFGSMCNIPVALATPSLFSVYKRFPKLKDAFVLGISQSGQSPDIVSVLEEARKQGVFTASITNHMNSPLAETSDFVLNCHAGEEKSIAATKTYTSQLMILAILAATYSGSKKSYSELEKVPDYFREALKIQKKIASLAQRYRYMSVCAVIGRGYNYSTAYEIALKLKELNYVIAEPYSSADFMHGPFAIVEDGFPVLVIAAQGMMYNEIVLFIKKLKAKGAELIIISDEPDALENAHTPFPIPVGVPEWVSPIVAVLPGQLFAYYLTIAKGLDSEKPRSLQKVTKTL